MRLINLLWLCLSLGVIGLDQLTKWEALQRLSYGHPVPLFPGFNLTLIFNTGAAFSMLSGEGGWQRWLFIALAVVVALALIGWLVRLSPREGWVSAALALILGGALSNALDRITRHHVIDFIDVYYKQWHWPVFNLADSAITLGAAILVIRTLLKR